ncbi:MAG TPA: DUF5698 domain-containing protein [Tepidisphaeraceae bacterium]|nr:DUF5698 domain-containing protein [Tepidisphaeraceae bacterium]
MTVALGALLIFCLRILDVPIGTLRVMYMVRGDRLRAVPLAFLESATWIFAISRIIKHVDDPLNMLAFAGGFAAGTLVGMTVEKWIASGFVLVRVISGADRDRLAGAIRSAGFGVTVLAGEGREGEQAIHFIVTLRRRGRELLDLVRGVDDDAFITVDPVQRAMGGYLPVSGVAEVKK